MKYLKLFNESIDLDSDDIKDIENILNIIGDEGFPITDRSTKNVQSIYLRAIWLIERADSEKGIEYGDNDIFVDKLIDVINRIISDHKIRLDFEYLKYYTDTDEWSYTSDNIVINTMTPKILKRITSLNNIQCVFIAILP